MKGGCCNNAGGGPDFSMLTLPSGLSPRDSNVMSGLLFWLAGLALVVGPYIGPVICMLERWTGMLKIASQNTGLERRKLYSWACLFYFFISHISYHKMLQSQPYSPCLQNNQVLALGYILFLAGLSLKASCVYHQGWTAVIITANANDCIGDCRGDNDINGGMKDTNTPSEKKMCGIEEKTSAHCDYHSTASTILSFLGYSFLMARVTSLIICILLLSSHASDYWLQRSSSGNGIKRA